MGDATTTPIEEKKADSNNTLPDYKKFAIAEAKYLLYIFLFVFVFGTYCLYVSKISIINEFIPTNVELFPFTTDRNNNINITNPPDIDINIIRDLHNTGTDIKIASQKAQFKVNDFYNSLSGVYNSESTNDFYTFFQHVCNSVLSINNAISTHVFSGFASNCWESITMIVGGFLFPFYLFFMYIFSYCTSLFYCCSHIKDLLGVNGSILSYKLIYIVLFFCLVFPIFLMSFVTASISFIRNLILPLYTTYTINGSHNTKIQSFIDFFISSIVYKSQLIFWLVIATLSSNILTYIGSSGFIGVVIAIIVFYFMGFFKSDNNRLSENNFTLNLAYKPPGIKSKVNVNKPNVSNISKFNTNAKVNTNATTNGNTNTNTTTNTYTNTNGNGNTNTNTTAKVNTNTYTNTNTNGNGNTNANATSEIEMQPIVKKQT